MNIIVTPTETALIAEFESKEIEIIKKPLLIGDIQIVGSSDVISIIERKTGDDLIASIKDGRYHEQKSRILQSGLSPNRVFYLIEGLPKKSIRLAAMYKSMWSAITNTIVRDGFNVFSVTNIGESVEFLTSLKASLEKHTRDQIVPDQIVPEQKVNVNIKKPQVQSNDFYKAILLLIPKVGEACAVTLIKEFPTLDSLKAVFNKNGASAVSEIKMGNRKIGVLSETIFEYIQKI